MMAGSLILTEVSIDETGYVKLGSMEYELDLEGQTEFG